MLGKGIITQLSEQITTLTERVDDFTSHIEGINLKISTTNASSSQQNLAVQAKSCNGTAQPALFMAGNGAMNGTLVPSSASSSQLARESQIMEEILLIGRSRCQIIHQIDNLNNILQEYSDERSRQGRTDRTGRIAYVDSIGIPAVLIKCLLGLTNGYLTSVLMILGAKTVLVQHAKIAGIVLVISW